MTGRSRGRGVRGPRRSQDSRDFVERVGVRSARTYDTAQLDAAAVEADSLQRTGAWQALVSKGPALAQLLDRGPGETRVVRGCRLAGGSPPVSDTARLGS